MAESKRIQKVRVSGRVDSDLREHLQNEADAGGRGWTISKALNHVLRRDKLTTDKAKKKLSDTK